MTDYEVNRLKDQLEARDLIIDDYDDTLKDRDREIKFWKILFWILVITNASMVVGWVFQ